MRDQRGFTLLELLIAITLLAAITAILAGGFSLSLRSWEAGQERMQGHYDLTEGMTLIGAQLRSPQMAWLLDEKNEKTLAFIGEKRSLLFVAGAPRLKPLAEADGFYLQRLAYDDKGKALAFAEAWFDPRTPLDKVEWTATALGEGKIADVSFEYLYREGKAGEEKDVWYESTAAANQPTALPPAVRVTLTVQDEKDPFVYPPFTVWRAAGAEIALEPAK